ncbi:MAG: RagB/SusD family nutrient uptake outer membrane protein [Agriterribacter sp.]
MKRIKTVLGTILLVLSIFGVFSGCKKFLDRKPLTATLDDIPGGGVEGQILGLYGAIRFADASGNGFGGIMWLGLHSARGDDADATADPNGTGYANIYDRYIYAVDDWGPNTYYEQHYKLQALANTAIQTIDSLDLSDPDNQRRKAEAMWFRALTYFDLVRVYGEVPLILKRVYNASEANVPKSSAADIYAAIDADLTFAAQHLPLNWVSATGDNRYPGRLTVGAAKALHAKTYLQRGMWAQALTLANDVINSGEYDLHPSFGNLWTTAGESSKERIFDIQAYQSAGRKDDYWSWWGTEQGVRGSGDWNLGWGFNIPSKALVDSFDANDPRKFETILFSGAPDDTSFNYPAVKSRGYNNRRLPPYPGSLGVPYWNKKTYTDPAEQVLVGDVTGAAYVNQPVLRFADVLLMAAEAANETGDGELAETYVERVRNRARGGNAALLPKIEFTSQLQMRNAIKHERLVELAMEGGRFFDLVRWGDAQRILGPSGYQPKHALYPLPKPEVDKSDGVLKQNPDY